MSETTFKNARPQRLYRERAQPLKRKHLGLLEKHKDYKQRAVNYHRRQDKLKDLQLKAALRNKDEFNFKMVKGSIQDGKHIEAESSEDEENFDPKEYKKIVKTQNQNLLKVQFHINEQRVQRLQEGLHYISAPKQNTHKFFVDTNEDVESFKVPQPIETENTNKFQYLRLEEAKKQRDRMRNYYLKLDYEKGLLTGEKKKIKKYKDGKIHKFTRERKR